MARLSLRTALEGDAPETPVDAVVMTGPLAEIYRNALDIAYAKPDPITGEPKVATESQAIDAMIAKQLADAITKSQDDSPGKQFTVYGVSKVSATDEDVVAVAKQLSQSENPDEFILVVDSTVPGPNGETGGTREYLESVATMESMVHAYGGRVRRSLEEIMEDLSGAEYKPASPLDGTTDNPDLPEGEVAPAVNGDPGAQTPQDKD